MRIIYRSVSKRQLSSHSPSLTRDLLERARSYFLDFFSNFGSIRSACCQFLLCGLAWVAILTLVLPWVGPFFVVCCLCKNRTVPWLFKRVSAPEDILETSVGVRGTGSGFYHIVLHFEGPVCQRTIQKEIDSFISLRSRELNGWKIKTTLVRLRFGFWAWRQNKDYNVTNHIAFCDEIWQGVPLNSQNLKYKINELCGVPLNGLHPPWDVHVVPYIQKETRAICYALLIRAHHQIAHFFRIEDFSLYNTEEGCLRNALFRAFSQIEDNTSLVEENVPDTSNYSEPNVQPVLEDNIQEVLHQTVKQVMYIVGFLWKAPAMLLDDGVILLRQFIKSWNTTGCKSRRALGWSDRISEELINRLKDASGAESVEAVLLSCFSGALHHYKVISGNSELSGDMVRSLIPQANGFIRVVLPVGERCPKARLRIIQRSLRRGKSDIKYKLSCILASVWSTFLPSSIGSYIASLFCQRYPVLLDSVNVPASDCSIMEVNYWKLAPVDFGLSLTFVHYGGHVMLSVMSNFETLQRPDLLASSFDRAVLDLALAYNVRYERKPSPPSTPTKTSFSRGI